MLPFCGNRTSGDQLPAAAPGQPAGPPAAQQESRVEAAVERADTAAKAVAAGHKHRLPLGVRNPGLMLPNAGGGPEDVLLYFGIIDILQVGPHCAPQQEQGIQKYCRSRVGRNRMCLPGAVGCS